MVSLTTVYGISIFLTSLAGMGSAFVGNKIYPLKGGAVELPPTPAEVEKATAEADKAARAAAVKAAKLAAADLYQVKNAQKVEETVPESVVEPIPEPVAAPEPTPVAVAEPIPEPVAAPEPIPEPVAVPEPVVEPVAVPEGKPFIASFPEPTPVTESLTVPEGKPFIASFPEPTPVTETAIQPAAASEEKPVPTPPAEQVNILEDAIKTEFNMNDEFANGVIDFIKTPVKEWTSIASTASELRRKFKKTLTHANQNKCPKKLLDLCKIVSIKYSNMKDFIENNPYIPYGDQTMEAISLLSNTEQK